jgi:hypothetical protein
MVALLELVQKQLFTGAVSSLKIESIKALEKTNNERRMKLVTSLAEDCHSLKEIVALIRSISGLLCMLDITLLFFLTFLTNYQAKPSKLPSDFYFRLLNIFQIVLPKTKTALNYFKILSKLFYICVDRDARGILCEILSIVSLKENNTNLKVLIILI